MNLDEQVRWFSRKTPSHLDGVTSRDCPDHGLGPGGHGEKIAIGYRLTCKCSGQKFNVSAYRWQRDPDISEVMLSPIHASCSECGHDILVFDSNHHGYNPVACSAPSLMHGEEEDSAVKQTVTPTDLPQAVDIIAYYPDDLFGPEFDEFANRQHDLFTWLTIVVGETTNPDCPILSFECA